MTADISDSKRAGYDARVEPPFERSSVASRVRSIARDIDRSIDRSIELAIELAIEISIELAIDRTRDRNIDRVWVYARVRIQYQSHPHPQLRQCRGPLLAVASRAMASGSRASCVRDLILIYRSPYVRCFHPSGLTRPRGGVVHAMDVLTHTRCS